jgi:hypothetical protein
MSRCNERTNERTNAIAIRMSNVLDFIELEIINVINR